MALCFETSVGRLQAITYFLSTIISFFVVVPIGITIRNFQGSCVLYAQVVWDGRTIWPWSETSCDFILYMNLGVTLLYAFLMGIYSTCATVPRRFPFAEKHYQLLKPFEDHDERYKIMGINPVFMLINTIVFLLVLSNAVVISVGFERFCTWTVEAVKETNPKIDSCGDIQRYLNWDEFRIIRGETVGVTGNQVYSCLTIACIASWLLFIVWLFQWILNFSQSFTMCSCEVAEEKQKPDQATVIAARRSRLATPIGTPGGPLNLPPMDKGPHMRPYTFGPQGGSVRSVPQAASVRSMPQYVARQPQQKPPMQLQQGYVPPRQY